jgi:hypothetical protein
MLQSGEVDVTWASYKVTVPDRGTGNCLDSELPGTDLKEGRKKRSGPPSPSKKSQFEPSRDGETMRRDQRGILSGYDEGGSAAIRVRRLLFPLLNNPRHVIRSIRM